AGEIDNDGYHHAGNAIGQILGWLWQCSDVAALRWLARYAAALTDALARRRINGPPFDPLWRSVSLSLQIALEPDVIADFQRSARGRLPDFIDIFTAAELAGGDRPRGDDDPWPDTTPAGRCFAKKRWTDIRV